ncbi:pilus assembly protein PilM [Candidatus Nitrospira allomarina]|uniref:Pilus assembly protein PilM n=1 Tax=Candidatus Nitrospira allomarina TaxID=3020900 RepID=A0AA96GCG1_9BACT|nr:pilus assembly protein PilM [Candidatus Nitrospira allomarina]WNM59529.1 pilus assembly protein PilM [Candidatus Nitrospira allomarina]
MNKIWGGIVERVRGFSWKSQNVTGVDVGSRVLKAVTLQPGHTSPILKGIVLESLPYTLNPNPQTDLEDDRRLVQFLRRQLSPFPRAVGITISSPHVLLKRLTLPYMSEKDLREHLALELDRYIPLDVQGAVWDVYRHKDSEVLGNEQNQTVLVVAKKEFIEARMQQFEGQGMHVRFVDVDAFSLVNMVAYNYGREETWMIIHLGPTGILSVMMEEGRLVHMHQVSYEVEWYGDLLDGVQAAVASAGDGFKLGASETLLLEQFFNEIIKQVIESIKYASEGTDMGMVQGVFLSGGYSMLEGLQSRLADSLHVSVTLVNPFKKITVPQEMQQDSRFQKALPLFGVAVGAALRGAIPHD